MSVVPVSSKPALVSFDQVQPRGITAGVGEFAPSFQLHRPLLGLSNERKQWLQNLLSNRPLSVERKHAAPRQFATRGSERLHGCQKAPKAAMQSPSPWRDRRVLGTSSLARRRTCLQRSDSKKVQVTAAIASQSPPAQQTTIFPPFIEELFVNQQDLPPFAPVFEKQFDGLTLSSREGASSEEFIRRAHELAVSWLPSELQTRLEGFLDKETGPSVLVVRGLPVDKDPPSTPYEVGNTSKKPGKIMSEAWVLAISKILGQPVTYETLVERGLASGLVCDLTPHPGCADKVAFDGSKRVLDLHRDFAVGPEKLVADALLLIGVRGDPRKEAKTTVCDFRALLATMTPDNVSILRSEPIGWDGGRDVNRDYSIERKLLVSGPDSNPVVNIFEEEILAAGAASLQGSPQLLAAYGRLKENARKLAVGVWLDGGDLLIVNNRRAAHGRTAYSAVFDGSDRWVQRVWVKKELQEGPGDFTRVLRFAS